LNGVDNNGFRVLQGLVIEDIDIRGADDVNASRHFSTATLMTMFSLTAFSKKNVSTNYSALVINDEITTRSRNYGVSGLRGAVLLFFPIVTWKSGAVN